MEKLLELLREYSTLIGERTEEYGNPIRGWNEKYLTYPIEIMRIKSKEYGFIERLVKNDNINMNKVERDAISYFRDESPVYGDKIWTTRLIMMLSVSNSPIKDLIYYLGKEDDEHYIKPGGYKLVFNAKK